MSNVTIQGKKSTDRTKPEEILVTGGGAHVKIGGAVTAVTGTPKWHPMAPSNTFTGTAATENYQDSTGCKKFWLDLGDTAVGAGKSVIISWSEDASNTATTQAACIAAQTALGTPDGAAIPNTITISDLSDEIKEIFYDGSTRIKTISILTDTAPAAGFTPILYTVE